MSPVCVLRCGVVAVLLQTTVAAALEDCTPYVEEFDAKLEAARAAGQDVTLAQQMRESLTAACPFLDEASARKMADSLDELLPAMATMQEQRKAAEQALTQPAASPPPTTSTRPRPPVAPADLPESGRSLGGRLVDRPDEMFVFAILDMDLHDGSARVLYDTRPSLEQAVQPDWETVIYVVEVDPGGDEEQHLIHREQNNDHAALALRRGAGEIIWERQGGRQGEEAFLELWSISERARKSRVPSPSPARSDARPHRWGPFRGPTSDGNVFYMSLMPAPRNSPTYTLAWFEASPQGEVLGRGSRTTRDKIAPYAYAEAIGGRGAAVVVASLNQGESIESRVDTPIHREVAGRKMYATVGSEKRLLVLSDDARSFEESPALERMLAWHGQTGIPQDLSFQEMTRQNAEQMAMMRATGRAVDDGRTLKYLNVGYKRVEMIRPMGADRYAALVKVHDDRRLDPPRHGHYLLEVTMDSITERLYLEPLAKALELQFVALAVSPRDEMYLLALHRATETARVIRVGADWTIDGYADTDQRRGIQLDGMVADASGVWLFGRGLMAGKGGERLWVERVIFETP